MTLRRAAWWAGGFAVLTATLAAGALFSPLARITAITVDGELAVPERLIVQSLETGSDGSFFGHGYRLPSLFVFNGTAARAAVLSAFPQIAEVTVVADWPHTVRVTVAERVLAGAWCRGASCRYWDRSGARWGTAVPSVGPLLLLVVDERAEDSMDSAFLQGMLAAVDGTTPMGLKVRRIVLPDAEPGGVRLELAQGYELRMDALGDIADQLATLQVFLGEKAKDPIFRPVYLDLRTLGRVYFQ
jgi:cell division septal protein FtsQ